MTMKKHSQNVLTVNNSWEWAVLHFAQKPELIRNSIPSTAYHWTMHRLTQKVAQEVMMLDLFIFHIICFWVD